MAILNSCCCCGCSIRQGSFASGIYTLIFHSLVLAFVGLTIDESFSSEINLSLTIATLILSLLCVVSSVILLIGICVGYPILTIPWVISVNITNIFDSCASITLLAFLDESVIYKSILFILVFLICALNFYCTLCIISQYQICKEEQRRIIEETMMVGTRYKTQCNQNKPANEMKAKQKPIKRQAESKNFLTPDYCPDGCKNINRIPSSVISDSVSISDEKTEIQYNLENEICSTPNNESPTNGIPGQSLCSNLDNLTMPMESQRHVRFGEESLVQSSIVLKVPIITKPNT